MDSIYFYYNGKRSSDLGVYLVNLENGLKSTRFLSDKQIISEKIAGNDTPYIFGVERSPLTYTLILTCIEEKWTLDKRREIARWLDTDTFEEFYAEDAKDKRYYFQYQGGIDLTHNAAEDGYIQVEMLNISPYAYSPFQQKRYDLSTITTPTIIEFENNGDMNVKPELWITKIGNGDLTIRNLSNSGKPFTFTGIVDREELYIDNKNRHIETDLIDTYRYDNFSHNYLDLVRGVNRLEVTGACYLSFKWQYVIKG